MAFERTESYMHRCAKEVLASWLRSYKLEGKHCFVSGGERVPSPSLNNGVWLEYCFASSKDKNSFPFIAWENYLKPKSDSESFPYEYIKEKHTFANLSIDFSKCVVADIAIKPDTALMHSLDYFNMFSGVAIHDCCFVFEVVHSHPVSQTKLDVYKDCGIISVYEVSASWILSQIIPQQEIQCINVHHPQCHQTVSFPQGQSAISVAPSINYEDIWSHVVGNIEPMGSKALFNELGILLHFDGRVARVGFKSKPLFPMAQGKLENLEKSFTEYAGNNVVVSLEFARDVPF